MVSTVGRPDIQGPDAGLITGPAAVKGAAPSLSKHYLPYLLLKAVASDGGCAATLVALGIEADNRAKVLMTRTVAEAGEKAWLDFLSRLAKRSPALDSLRLVVIDGSPALLLAVERTWPRVRRQICWFHELRKLLHLLGPEAEAACLAGVWAIPEAASLAAAVSAYYRWAARWQSRFPAAVRLLERDLPLLLAFLSEPPEVRGGLRSIDGLSWVDGGCLNACLAPRRRGPSYFDGRAPATGVESNFGQDRKFPAAVASI